jgi:hypothetical protein
MGLLTAKSWASWMETCWEPVLLGFGVGGKGSTPVGGVGVLLGAGLGSGVVGAGVGTGVVVRV